METLMEKLLEWDMHTLGCPICHSFEHPIGVPTRALCKEGRAIIVQILQLLNEVGKGLRT